MSFWVFLDYGLEKAIGICGINNLKFAEMQKIVQNKKKKNKKNFHTKNAFLCVF